MTRIRHTNRQATRDRALLVLLRRAESGAQTIVQVKR